MPDSKSRKNKTSAPQVQRSERSPQSTTNPRWLAPVMLGLMLAGLAWIVVFYLTSSGPDALLLPIPSIGQWNLAVGFGLIIVGFGLTTRWR